MSALNKTVLLKVANNDYYAKSAVRRGQGDIVERNVARLTTDPTVTVNTYAPVTTSNTYKKKQISEAQAEFSRATLIELKAQLEKGVKTTKKAKK